jgi:hypothetical protein
MCALPESKVVKVGPIRVTAAHLSRGGSGSSESRRLIRVAAAHPSHGGSSESRRLIRVAEPGPCAGCACAGAAGGGCGWREVRGGVTRPRAACYGDAAAWLWAKLHLLAMCNGLWAWLLGGRKPRGGRKAIGGDASRGPGPVCC